MSVQLRLDKKLKDYRFRIAQWTVTKESERLNHFQQKLSNRKFKIYAYYWHCLEPLASSRGQKAAEVCQTRFFSISTTPTFFLNHYWTCSMIFPKVSFFKRITNWIHQECHLHPQDQATNQTCTSTATRIPTKARSFSFKDFPLWTSLFVNRKHFEKCLFSVKPYMSTYQKEWK